ncbi:hypothetical protein SAMN04488564_101686 [Lentzea waywayandensis]|uniref:Uncharacterized protein n=1 Tax=Lentzea waywayandensis TaxID=84724 RepID=A0A1I6D073_9PSEU|nr:hypothetical protein [Lentzea waywayandensis]SFQ98723.1 hypothetical protein SAMN04488564_101686 [Lentzea waywayandensis]
MKLHVLSGVDLGPEFHALVKKIHRGMLKPRYRRVSVLFDDLAGTSARVDLVRLATIAALEQTGESVELMPVSARGHTVGLECVIGVADNGDGTVRVTAAGVQVDVLPPSEEDCHRLLTSGVRGTAMRFPVFPSSCPSLVARGDGPDELVLWRCGLAPAKVRLPGPVLAAIHVSDRSGEVLKALVEIDGELIYMSHDEDPAQCELRIPIRFSVAAEAKRDLSPLYLDMDEPWRYGVYFRRAGKWWNLHYHGGTITLKQSTGTTHQPGSFPWHAKVYGGDRSVFGPGYSHAERRHGTDWTVTGTGAEQVITVPPGEHVLGLTEVGKQPALLTREGNIVRARRQHDVRTVVEFKGPVIQHYEAPWVAVQRSPHLVEVIDIATGAVLHRLDTA